MNRRNRTEIAIYAVSALLLAGTAAIWWQGIRPSPDPADVLKPVGAVQEEAGEPASPAGPAPTIFVHIAGAVKDPGVYRFEEGQRLFEALELVGLAENADVSSLNLASVLRDSQKVYVPAVGEDPPPSSSASPTSGQGSGAASGGPATPAVAFPLDLNTASQAELEMLPGIGPVLAKAIIARREEIGPYQRPEDLLDVSGIGSKTLEKIASLVVAK